ncbi:MAG TPA: peptide ABC transporter substrate-binding protein [Clostridia bacterium]|nr:peptide ABC transporter substrate-binding protein [Clostridia bacterium]
MKTTRAALPLALALCLLLSPAGALASDSQSLIIGIVSATTTRLNPLTPVEREFMSLTALVYEPLVGFDDEYLPKGVLAERWDTSGDGGTWTFTLREGLVFHDGSPLTSADVVATVTEILRLANDEAAANKGAYSTLKYFVNKITATDERTVVITTPRKNFGFLYAMNFPILPQAQVQADNPIGSGPYTVEQFMPADYIWLSVNSLWWGGKPAITEISALFHATNRELISSYEYNRVDAILTRSMTAAQYRSGVSSLNLSFRTRQLETLMLNRRSYELEDVRVRKAIRAALNLDAIAQNAYMGMAQRTDTPLPSGTWMYRADEAVFRQNLDLARQLLDEAGWTDTNDDGVRDMVREGKSVKLSLRFYVYEEQDNSVRANVAAQIVSQLAAVGVEARLTVMSFKEAREKLEAGSYDLAMASFNMDYTPDPGFLLMSGNTGNYARYNSKAMDTLFSELRSSLSREAYQNKLYQIQELYAEDCPFITLYYRAGAILTRVMFTRTRDIREPEALKGIEARAE